VDAIIVCKGAGEVITSTSGPLQCSTLPEGYDFLAAPLKMLEILALRQGDTTEKYVGHVKVGKTAVWTIPSDPFTPCTHENDDKKSCWEKQETLQQLGSPPGKREKLAAYFVSEKKPHGGADMRRIPTTGAVVFGMRDGKSG
jgi:hypothetical protein